MDRPEEPRNESDQPYASTDETSGFPPRRSSEDEPVSPYREPYEEEPQEPKRRGGGKAFFVGLIGGIIGALLIALIAWPFVRDEMTSPTPVSNATPEQAATKATESENDIVGAVGQTKEAVVSVTNLQSSFQGADQETGAGSGVIYKKDGNKAYVVTNYHVVEGASRLSVTLSDGTALEAKVLGEDPTYDLAVLSIDASKVTQVVKLGDSDTLRAGETVLAIGNPLGIFANSVTRGVISAQERTVPVDTNKDGQQDFNTEVIQTDAAINPGNSGGALINTSGQLIGINSMKIAEASVEGVGFAIPINEALPIMRDLEQNGEVIRPQLGIQIRDVQEFPSGFREDRLKLPSDVNRGIVVVGLTKNSGAAKAGMKENDVIVEINGKDIRSFADLKSVLYRDAKVGDNVKVTFYRGGEKQTLDVKLSAQAATVQ
ncbi:S1C family serine protease [Exiguobacterium artemiae]|uniref:S1C family serine protease n=1 Tax=Exiguobacterium artemiae TaxID=340145 RepID=UPI000479937B|nr:trypsin-like peptidase domain-containing protein [Exiguobacterium sibiricum]